MKSLSISSKILFGYAGVLVITLVAAVLLTQTSRGVQDQVGMFIDDTLPQLSALEQVGAGINRLEISAFSLYGTTIDVDTFDQERRQHAGSIDQQFSVLGGALNTDGLSSALQDLASGLDQLRRVMAANSVDWDAARVQLASLSGEANSARQQLSDIKQQVQQSAADSSVIIEDELAGSVTLVVVLVSVIALFAMVAYSVSRQQIAKPIVELSGTLEQVSRDQDLTQQLKIASSDEVGQAAMSVNQLLGVFRAGMSDVAAAIQGISQSVNTLGRASESSDATVSRLNQEIDRLVSVMVNLEEQIEHSVVRSEAASETAARGATEVQQGAREVENTSSSIAALAGDIETTADMLLQLRTAGDQVSSVVSTIAEIADQTNLLALNAAIEAARAGESGRGFAVVADEVRSLASKTHQSTVEINTMLDNIVTSITQSVDTMASNQEKAQQSVALAQTTVASLSDIQQTILDLSQASTEVAELAGAVRQEVCSVRSQVNEFKGLGDTVAQGSGETREASGSLRDLSGSLESLVGRFKV